MMEPMDGWETLARLRPDAKPMPFGQMDEVLTAAWGTGWDARFAQFGFTPIAAASIGQVHRATTKDGRPLAIKVQYPGIRQSIASDVDNVGTLLRVSGLLPAHLDVAPLLAEAKRQLHEEADYLREARCQAQFAALLADPPNLRIPTVHADWTTENVLAMDYVECVPIESLQRAPQAQRDEVASTLMGLLFRELFEFRLVQTDPNFANYRYDKASGRTELLDFGATPPYGSVVVDGSMTVRDLVKVLEVNFDLDGPKTVNGLIVEYFQDIPEPGTCFRLSGCVFEVLQTQERGVKRVRILPPH